MAFRLRASALVALGTILLVPVTVLDGDVAADEPRSADRARSRPNIVLFMTDDQNVNDLRWMPKTRRLLTRKGMKFTRALSPAPLCCPARAETITGQYGQNNGVQDNTGPFGGFQSLRQKANTLAAWLQSAGYRTAEVGKYLNGYEQGGTPRQVGWTRWNPSVRRVYEYTNTSFLTQTGRDLVPGNITPAIDGYTQRDIRAFSATRQPFFLWVSHLPPHSARTPGPWKPPIPTLKHRHVLGSVALPSLRKPSFNVGGRKTPYPGKKRISAKRVQAEFTGRIRTLQDVDDAMVRLIRVLKRTHELANTYIFFVSDNGMLLGEHRFMDKNTLFSEDLEVPLIVRGPGIRRGTTSRVPVTIVDLAPTILDLAGVRPRRVQDGESFARILHGRPVAWRDTQLIQTGNGVRRSPQPGWEFRGVRTSRYTFMHRVRDGAEFLYDRAADPYELVSLTRKPKYEPVLDELRSRYRALIGCAGASCRRQFGPLPDVSG